jgi:hypothetical protein
LSFSFSHQKHREQGNSEEEEQNFNSKSTQQIINNSFSVLPTFLDYFAFLSRKKSQRAAGGRQGREKCFCIRKRKTFCACLPGGAGEERQKLSNSRAPLLYETTKSNNNSSAEKISRTE